MNNPMVEYFHPPTGKYFITLEGMETGILDADRGPDRWVRTGQRWGGWLGAADLPGATRVCRFRGDFGAGGSRFYTLEGTECASLRAADAAKPPGEPAWRFEGYAFSAAAPVNDTCPANLTPVYRLYDFGFERGGTPGHRYVVDRALHDAMVAQGWGAEGVRFCMPPASSNESF